MINMRNALTQLYPVRRHGSAGGRHAEGTTETCHDLVTQHLILLLENLADRRRSFSFGCVAMRHAMAAGSAQRHLVRGAQVRCPCRGAKGTRTPDLLVAKAPPAAGAAVRWRPGCCRRCTSSRGVSGREHTGGRTESDRSMPLTDGPVNAHGATGNSVRWCPCRTWCDRSDG
jgi:hypothetical protein